MAIAARRTSQDATYAPSPMPMQLELPNLSDSDESAVAVGDRRGASSAAAAAGDITQAEPQSQGTYMDEFD